MKIQETKLNTKLTYGVAEETMQINLKGGKLLVRAGDVIGWLGGKDVVFVCSEEHLNKLIEKPKKKEVEDGESESG